MIRLDFTKSFGGTHDMTLLDTKFALLQWEHFQRKSTNFYAYSSTRSHLAPLSSALSFLGIYTPYTFRKVAFI